MNVLAYASIFHSGFYECVSICTYMRYRSGETDYQYGYRLQCVYDCLLTAKSNVYMTVC